MLWFALFTENSSGCVRPDDEPSLAVSFTATRENYETEEEREAIEGVWNTISDDPLNYHFYYYVLDGDEGGRPPKIMASDGHQQIENKYFNWKDKSCLHAIVKSNNKVSFKKILVNASKNTGKC